MPPIFNPKHMKNAIDLSKTWIDGELKGPFGAVVVKNGTVIGRGSNSVVKTMDPTAHAEIVAIRQACEFLGTHILKGCELYASCEPCPMCLSAIYWARIDKVWFACTHDDASKAGFDDSFIYTEISKSHEHRTISMEQSKSNDAKSVFEKWKESTSKTPY